ncbi:MAG: TonB-dependent receptor [Blastocatellia bacterium]|nr:TonB-dependent receptor [Blastocatellia bacterium]
MTNKIYFRIMLAALFAVISSVSITAQVTTGEIVGRVVDGQNQPVAGAAVEATHEPTGTVYNTVTNDAGRYAIPAMRVGGPYTVKVSLVGFKDQTRNNIQLSLGTAATLNFNMSAAIDVEVTVTNDEIFSEVRTGAATSINNETVQSLPTINRTINDFTRLSPQAGGGGTFAGQDNRLNNITIDGSYFNNSFGLAGQPGERTGVSPISLDAIEEFQVNVAPYDVRQGNFVGAGVNTVTRSGTNQYNGSFYYLFRRPNLVGKEAGDNAFNPGNFKFRNWGFRVGGPMPFFNFGESGSGSDYKPYFISGKNKLFFFLSYENEELTEPGTTFVARNSTAEAVTGNVTRVLKSDLDNLSNYLRTNFNYETGPYQGYDHATPAKKWLFRTDYNINDKNRLTLRYIHLDSETDVLLSNSASLGFGNRRSSSNGLNFQNSNYKILENIRSFVGEWTSSFSSTVANSLIVGYTKQDESRDSRGSFFPMVDILDAGSVYTTFGFEPFTPNNELRYKSFQIQDNLTYYRGSHTLSAGVSFENYQSENVFFPGSQSVYIYNSLNDFYADANGYLANPNRTTSPITLRRFQVRWSNIPNLEKPIQPLKVNYVGFYGQDNWKVWDNFSLSYGLRIDVPFFGATGFANSQVDGLNFRDENGATVKYSTATLPGANILYSPRVGMNWSPLKSGRVQVRGGTGIFTARPAYVWISNQIGNNGVLTGFEEINNGTNRPFHPNPNRYKPTNVTGAPASSYELALTDPSFRFPQIWRSSLAMDVKIPWGLVAGAEFMNSMDVNGIYYINANLTPANTSFTGVDNRPRWTTSNRINSAITSAVVLKNQSVGKSWNLAFTLERPFKNGLYVKGAYAYGDSRNTVDPGSIAFGSWNGNQHFNNPNNPGVGVSASAVRHRTFGTVSYRKEYFKFGATSVSMFIENRSGGNGSYVFSGDLNGDGGTANDLIYIPKDQSEMNFGNITTSTGTITVTAAQQATAWEAFINQDPYLSKNRGKYAVRGAAFRPHFTRADLSVAQDLFFKVAGTTQKFQVRFDILNFGNMLNKNWGVGEAFTSLSPLITTSTSGTATCRVGSAVASAPSYCLRTTSGTNLINSSYIKTAGVTDVYRIQIGLRYIFNK